MSNKKTGTPFDVTVFETAKRYSCSPGDGSVVVPSVLLPFLWELCLLLEGFSVASPEDSVSLDVSALEPFFDSFGPFVPEPDGRPGDSEADSPFVPVPFISSPR